MKIAKLKPWHGCEALKEGHEEHPVKLTKEEALDRGQQLGRQSRQIGLLDETHKEIRKDLKDVMDGKKRERARLTGVVCRGDEPREVAVTSYVDWGAGMVYVVRDDTNESVRSRKVTEDEKQVNMLRR